MSDRVYIEFLNNDDSSFSLLVNLERELILTLAVQVVAYDLEPLISNVSSPIRKAILRALLPEKQVSCLALAFKDKELNWKQETISTEAKQMTYRVIFDSLGFMAKSKDIDLIAVCDAPNDFIANISTVTSKYQPCLANGTLFAFTKNIVNRVLQKDYSVTSARTLNKQTIYI